MRGLTAVASSLLLWSMLWALHSRASSVVAPRLSCPAACGIFSDQGLNPCPLHWWVDAYPGKCHLLVLILDTVPLDLGVLVLGSQTLHAPDSMQVWWRACPGGGVVSTPREVEMPTMSGELGCSTWSLNERQHPCLSGSRGWGRLIQAHLTYAGNPTAAGTPSVNVVL